MKIKYIDNKILEQTIVLKLNCNKIIRNLEKFQVKLSPILIEKGVYIPIKIIDVLYTSNRYLSERELKLDKNNKFLEIDIKNNIIKIDDKEIKEKLKEQKGEKYLNLEVFKLIGEKVFFYKGLIIISNKNNILDLKEDKLYIQLLKEELESKDIKNNILMKNKKYVDQINDIINESIILGTESYFKNGNYNFMGKVFLLTTNKNALFIEEFVLELIFKNIYITYNEDISKAGKTTLNIKLNNITLTLKVNSLTYEINGQKKQFKIEPFAISSFGNLLTNIYLPVEIIKILKYENDFRVYENKMIIFNPKSISLDEIYLEEINYRLFERVNFEDSKVDYNLYLTEGFFKVDNVNYEGKKIIKLKFDKFNKYKLEKIIEYNINDIDKNDLLTNITKNENYQHMRIKNFKNQNGIILPKKILYTYEDKKLEVCIYITESIREAKSLIFYSYLGVTSGFKKIENVDVGDSIIEHFSKYHLIFTRNNVVIEIYPLYSEKQKYTNEKLKEVYFEILKNLAIEIDRNLNNNLEYIF